MPRGVAFWLVGVTSTLLVMSSAVPSPMYVVYQQEWHFSAAMITVIFGVYGICVLGSMLLFGSLSDTVGRRPVLLGALVLMLAAMTLFALAHGVAWLLAARIVQGMGVGIATGTVGAALIELAPRNAPSRGTLVNTTAPVLGAAVGPLIGGMLVQYGPAPTVLSYLLLLAVFAVAGAVLVFLPETAPNAGGRFQLKPRRISIPAPARRSFAVLALTVATVWAFGGTFQALGPSLVADLLHSQNHLLGGAVVAVLAAAGAIGQPVFGRLTGRQPVVAGGVILVLGVIGLLAGMATSSVPVFIGGIAILGLGWGAVFMGAFRLMAALADPEHRGELLAAVYIVAYLGLSLPAIGAGIAVRYFGLYATMSVFAVVVAVLMVVSMAGLPLLSHRHRSAESLARDVPVAVPHPCCPPHPDATGVSPKVPVGV
ncbi:MFS transporter [Fodinicola feengrottensis]|uniref:MFS transporter n=1 Tax=Fodinicola feengrottensis TaxID=435914 RepID=A0ABN2HCB0_9ACTN